MHKARLEAFSDGVFAIIITIMVLEMKVPHADSFDALWELRSVFLSYVLSFVYVGIYWNNHHHMLQATHSVNGGILWANLHLLFWLSLMPFASGWMGENHFKSLPVALYGFVMLMCAVAYTVLAYKLVKHNGKESLLAKAVGEDWKGKVSMAIYATGVALSWAFPWVGFGLYVVVACIWFIPDRRIEDKMAS